MPRDETRRKKRPSPWYGRRRLKLFIDKEEEPVFERWHYTPVPLPPAPGAFRSLKGVYFILGFGKNKMTKGKDAIRLCDLSYNIEASGSPMTRSDRAGQLLESDDPLPAHGLVYHVTLGTTSLPPHSERSARVHRYMHEAALSILIDKADRCLFGMLARLPISSKRAAQVNMRISPFAQKILGTVSSEEIKAFGERVTIYYGTKPEKCEESRHISEEWPVPEDGADAEEIEKRKQRTQGWGLGSMTAPDFDPEEWILNEGL